MSSILTRSVTTRMLNEERMRLEEIQRIEHYMLLESTYEADFKVCANIEAKLYSKIKLLEKKVTVLYSTITKAYEAHNLRRQSQSNSPYDETAYEASLQIMCDIENKCYTQIEQLAEEIKILCSKIMHSNNEFYNKYKPYRQGYI